MIFSELYSAYYNTVAAVLAAAVSHPLTDSELRRIVGKNAFGESALHILPALKEERWQLIRADGTTPIRRRPDMPLTMLQRRWLKSIAMDPRIRLFGDLTFDFPEAEPLFRPEDILVFDKYSDGDPYEDETYIANFRLVLDAVRKKYPLHIEMASGKGGAPGGEDPAGAPGILGEGRQIPADREGGALCKYHQPGKDHQLPALRGARKIPSGARTGRTEGKAEESCVRAGG